MLIALKDFYTSSIVKAPRLYMFDRQTNTQAIEDVPDAVNLHSIFVSPTANTALTHSVATTIGRELGCWLQAFHGWALSSAQYPLRKQIRQNEPMRKLKRAITYDSFINVLENFPGALDGVRKTLEDVRDMASKEFETVLIDEVGLENWGLIHGDFWTGK